MKRYTQWFLIGLLSGVLLAGSGCAPVKNGTELDQGGPDAELQAAGKEICLEVRSGKMWQASRSRMFSSFQDAEKYVSSLELGGYGDWRLPTEEELYDLHYIFFWEKNGSCTMNRKGSFWSASEEGEGSLGYWETYFLCNPEYRYVRSKSGRGYARAVRP